uniref:Homeobox domain-containing protein n=1 Tax=Astatotilapia calliptera TaxID=8154 RepID=A0A3P8P8I5_ASTCA
MRNTCKPVLSEKQTQLQQAHIHQGVRLSLDNHAVRCQCKANSGGHEVYTSLTPHPLCPLGGKTRTKDKYRVVYTDHQRMELEKEFQFNRYITMRRKSELSMALSLSERQVKIWFQNRRAKERKINRKKLQHSQQASTTTPTPPVLCPHPEKLLKIAQLHDS